MTYSLIARDPATGDFGVVVQTRYFAVGRVVPWAAAGIGAVATQSFTEIAYGPRGLALMGDGMSAPDALAALIAEDPQQAVRQVAMVDRQGRVAVHTGANCVYAAGHAIGAQCSAQANMMARETVWQAMLSAYEQTSGGLAERLLAACDAAEREGGDVRGRQSAALIIVPARAGERPWEDRIFDLRVDDHPDPVGELRRLYAFARYHRRMEVTTERAMAGDPAGALVELEECCSRYPDEPEFAFRRALMLAGVGRYPEAAARLAQLGAAHPNWIETLRRFAAAGVIPAKPEEIEQLLGSS
jgi:uncharacterized Ntn-hydrolase superfamily protein